MQHGSRVSSIEVSISALDTKPFQALTHPFQQYLKSLEEGKECNDGGVHESPQRRMPQDALPSSLKKLLHDPLLWGSFYCHSKGYVDATIGNGKGGIWHIGDEALAKWLTKQIPLLPSSPGGLLTIPSDMVPCLVDVLEFCKWRSFHVYGSHIRQALLDHLAFWKSMVAAGGELAFAALEIGGSLLSSGSGRSSIVLPILVEAARAVPSTATLWSVCDALLQAADDSCSTLREFWSCLNALSAYQHLKTSDRLKVAQSTPGSFYSTLGQFAQLLPKYLVAAAEETQATRLVLRVCALYLDIVVNDEDEILDTDMPNQEIVLATMDLLMSPQPIDASEPSITAFRANSTFTSGYDKEYLGRVVLGSFLEGHALSAVVDLATKAVAFGGGSSVLFGMLGQGFDERCVLCAMQHLADSLQRLVDVVAVISSCQDMNAEDALSTPSMASVIVDANNVVAILGVVNGFFASDAAAISAGLVVKMLNTMPRTPDAAQDLASLMLMLVEGAWAPITTALPVATLCLSFLLLALRHSLREVAPMLLDMGAFRYLRPPPAGGDRRSPSPRQSALFVAVGCSFLSALAEHPDAQLYMIANAADSPYDMYVHALRLVARGDFFFTSFRGGGLFGVPLTPGDEILSQAISDLFKRAPATASMFGKEFGNLVLEVLATISLELSGPSTTAAAESPADAGDLGGAGNAGSGGDSPLAAARGPAEDSAGSNDEAEGASSSRRFPATSNAAPPQDKSIVQRHLYKLLALARAAAALFGEQLPPMTDATHPGITDALHDVMRLLLVNNMTLTRVGPNEQNHSFLRFFVFRNTAPQGSTTATTPGLSAVCSYLLTVISSVLSTYAGMPTAKALYRKKTGMTTAALILNAATMSHKHVFEPRVIECLTRAYVYVNMLSMQRDARGFLAGKHVPQPWHEAQLHVSLRDLMLTHPLRGAFSQAILASFEKVHDALVSSDSSSRSLLSSSTDQGDAHHQESKEDLSLLCQALLTATSFEINLVSSSDLVKSISAVMNALPAGKLALFASCAPVHCLMRCLVTRLQATPADSRVLLKIVEEWLPYTDSPMSFELCGTPSDVTPLALVKGFHILMPVMSLTIELWKLRDARSDESRVQQIPEGAADGDEDAAAGIMCPLCFKYFPENFIARHAADCQGGAPPPARSTRSKKKRHKKKQAGAPANSFSDDDECDQTTESGGSMDVLQEMQRVVLDSSSPSGLAFLRLTSIEANLQHMRSWFQARRFVTCLIDGGNAAAAAGWIAAQADKIFSQCVLGGDPVSCAHLLYLFGSRGIARVLSQAPLLKNSVIHASRCALRAFVAKAVVTPQGTAKSAQQEGDDRNSLRNDERTKAAATVSAAMSCISCLYLETWTTGDDDATSSSSSFAAELLLSLGLVFDVPRAESLFTQSDLAGKPYPSMDTARGIAANLAQHKRLSQGTPSEAPLDMKACTEIIQLCNELLTIPVQDAENSVAIRVALNQAHVLLCVCLEIARKKHQQASKGGDGGGGVEDVDDASYRQQLALVDVERVLGAQKVILTFNGEVETSATVQLLTAVCGDATRRFEDRLLHRTVAAIVTNTLIYPEEHEGTVYLELTSSALATLLGVPAATADAVVESLPRSSRYAVQYDVFMGSLQDVSSSFGFDKVIQWLQRYARLLVFQRDQQQTSSTSSKKNKPPPQAAAAELSQTYVWLSPETPLSEDEQQHCALLVDRIAAVARCGREEKAGLTEAAAAHVLRVVLTAYPSTRVSIDEASRSSHVLQAGQMAACMLMTDSSLYSTAVAIRMSLSYNEAVVKDAIQAAMEDPSLPFPKLDELFPCVAGLSELRGGPNGPRIAAAFVLRFPDLFRHLLDFLEAFVPAATHPRTLRNDGADSPQAAKAAVPNEDIIRIVLGLMFCACRSPNQLSCYRHPVLVMTNALALKETGEAVDSENYDDDDDDGSDDDGDEGDALLGQDQSSDEDVRDAMIPEGKTYRAKAQELDRQARSARLVSVLPLRTAVKSAASVAWAHFVAPPFMAEDYRYCLFLPPAYIAEPNVPPEAVPRFLAWAVSLLDNKLTDRYALNVCSPLAKTFAALTDNVLFIVNYCANRPPNVWFRAAPLVASLLGAQFRTECSTVFSKVAMPEEWSEAGPPEMRLVIALEKIVGLVSRHPNAVSLLQLTNILVEMLPIDSDDDDDDEEEESDDEDGDDGDDAEEYETDEEEDESLEGALAAANQRRASRPQKSFQRSKRAGISSEGGASSPGGGEPLPPRLIEKLPFHKCPMHWMHTYRSVDYAAKYTCDECDSSCRGYRFRCAPCNADICPSCAWERSTPDAADTPKDERLAKRADEFGRLLARRTPLFEKLFALVRHPLSIPVFSNAVASALEHIVASKPDPNLPLFSMVASTTAAALQHAASTVAAAADALGVAHRKAAEANDLKGHGSMRLVAQLIHAADPVLHGSVDLGFTLMRIFTDDGQSFLPRSDELCAAAESLISSLDKWLSAASIILASANISSDMKTLKKHMTMRDYLLQLLDTAIAFLWAQETSTNNTQESGAVGTPTSGGAPPAVVMTRSFFLTRSDTELLTAAVDNRSALSDEANTRDPSSEPEMKITERALALLATHRHPIALLFHCIPDLSQFHGKPIEHFFLSPKLGDYGIRYEAYLSRNNEVLSMADEVMVHVDRANLLHSSLQGFKELLDDDLGEIVQVEISFEGEMGVDDGGPKREFVNAFLQEVVRAGILVQVPDTVTYEINPNPSSIAAVATAVSIVEVYTIVGFVMGMACTNSIPVEIHLAKSIYRHLIGVEPCFSDLESIDPGLFNSLLAVNNMTAADEFETLCQAFTVTIGGPDGTLEEVELIPGGSSIMVCDANKKDYIRKRSEFRMTQRVRPQLLGLLKGFYGAHHRSWLKAFTASELEVVLCGLPTVDIEDMRAHSNYQNCDVTTTQVRWFWEYVSSMSQKELATLMQFSTGCSKVPAGGFAAMRNKFTLNLVQGPEDRLPVAHTCYATIDLPYYKSAEVLASKFRTALELGTVGFDLV